MPDPASGQEISASSSITQRTRSRLDRCYLRTSLRLLIWSATVSLSWTLMVGIAAAFLALWPPSSISTSRLRHQAHKELSVRNLQVSALNRVNAELSRATNENIPPKHFLLSAAIFTQLALYRELDSPELATISPLRDSSPYQRRRKRRTTGQETPIRSPMEIDQAIVKQMGVAKLLIQPESVNSVLNGRETDLSQVDGAAVEKLLAAAKAARSKFAEVYSKQLPEEVSWSPTPKRNSSSDGTHPSVLREMADQNYAPLTRIALLTCLLSDELSLYKRSDIRQVQAVQRAQAVNVLIQRVGDVESELSRVRKTIQSDLLKLDERTYSRTIQLAPLILLTALCSVGVGAAAFWGASHRWASYLLVRELSTAAPISKSVAITRSPPLDPRGGSLPERRWDGITVLYITLIHRVAAVTATGSSIYACFALDARWAPMFLLPVTIASVGLLAISLVPTSIKPLPLSAVSCSSRRFRISRRALVSAALLGTIVAMIAELAVFLGQLRGPRKRLFSDRVDLPSGWYRNVKSGVRYFVWDGTPGYFKPTSRRAVGALGISEHNLVPVTCEELFKYPVNENRYTINCEIAAIALMVQGQYDQAFQFLLNALECPSSHKRLDYSKDAANLRLYDLLAAAAAYARDRETLNQLISLTKARLDLRSSSTLSKHEEELRLRLAKWQQERWFERLSARSEYSWSGVVLPPPRLTANARAHLLR